MKNKPTLSRIHAGGFTLIEILVVIAIILILAGISVAVGVQLKAGSARKYTLSVMITLHNSMKDYLDGDGANPEPGLVGPAHNLIPWPYPAGDPAFAPTQVTNVTNGSTVNPSSDPVNWVAALNATQNGAKALQRFNTGKDVFTNTTILDGWGTPIRYVPYNTNGSKQDGYFVSAGPDKVFSNAVPPGDKQDDIYSFDAH